MADRATSLPAASPDRRPTLIRRRLRFIPLGIGALAMAAGVWTGLQRLGLPLPGDLSVAGFHAAFMVAGFLGTVISLERAVAVDRWWAYAAPALSATGALALLGGRTELAALMFLAAGGVLLAVSAGLAARQFALFTVMLAIGAACWAAGTWRWLAGAAMPEVAGWWLSFLILTIAAERLELSRLLRVSLASQVGFVAVVGLLLVGGARGELAGEGAPFTIAGLFGCAAWLLRHDIARKTIRQDGLPRFSAIAILAGHGWLAVAGLVLALDAFGSAVQGYDAAVHAIAIGFVLSMVFGHAPIILPAVTGLRLRLTNAAYGPLALLHGSVVLRLAGDLSGWSGLRQASGVVTVLALIGYAGTLAATSRRKHTPSPGGQPGRVIDAQPRRKAPRIEVRSSDAS
jgi:hypothetical protein